jgi:hypothetical protein
MFSSFFTGPETHPEAKSMKDFYEAIGSIVAEVKKSIPNANSDHGFQQAAKVMDQIAKLCCDMESVEANDALEINTQRKELEPEMGVDGTINVTGEASRLLAQKYNVLLKAAIEKKYWPVESCPTSWGQSLLTVYSSTFENRCKKYRNIIEESTKRITAYDRSHQLKPAV